MKQTKQNKITINGNTVKCDIKALNIPALLEREGFADKNVAIAINAQFIPRSSYDTYIIKEGDNIEIVAPMQGG